MFQISIRPDEIAALELASFPGEIVVIDSEGPEMDQAVRYLKKQKVLGFDTETRPTFSPEQRSTGTALLQLSGSGKAYLFRLKKCGLPRALASVLASPSILKVGAATLDDVRGLQRITQFAPKGFVDLQNMVWEYGIRDKSAFQLGSRKTLRRTAEVRRHRRLGVPGDVPKAPLLRKTSAHARRALPRTISDKQWIKSS